MTRVVSYSAGREQDNPSGTMETFPRRMSGGYVELTPKSTKGIPIHGLDPNPEWTLDDLNRELDGLLPTTLEPLLPCDVPVPRHRNVVTWRDLREPANFKGRSGPFRMHAPSFDSSDSSDDSDVENDEAQGSHRYEDDGEGNESTSEDGDTSRNGNGATSEIEEDLSRVRLQGVENRTGGNLLTRPDLEAVTLFELRKARCLRMQEMLRTTNVPFQRMIMLQRQHEAERIADVERDMEAKQERLRAADRQSQREIAEARDSHLSQLQRHHQQRLETEDRKLKRDAEVEELAIKAEREKQLKAKAEEEEAARRKAEAEAAARRKAEAEAAARQKAAIEAEKRAKEEAAAAVAAAAAASSAARARELSAAPVIQGQDVGNRVSTSSSAGISGTQVLAQPASTPGVQQPAASGGMKELPHQGKTSQSSGSSSRVRISGSAAAIEAERLKRIRSLEEAVRPYERDELRKKERRAHERKIILAVQQISATQEQVRRKSRELVELLSNQRLPQQFMVLSFASKMLSQCEVQVQKLPTFAFPLASVAVNVALQVPVVIDILLARLHEVCIYTVPKYYLYNKSAYASYEEYFKKLGYREEDGKQESEDDYVGRMTGYMTFYGAIIQTEVGSGTNPHGLPHGWAWMARLLNTLPPNRSTASALEAVLKVAGYRLYREYPKPFLKLIATIDREFVSVLREKNDPDARAVVSRLQMYIQRSLYKQVPDGRDLPVSDMSSTYRA